MPKFIVIKDNGNIVRTINLPYEGILLDISNMDDEEFQNICKKIQTIKISINDGEIEMDEKGLPKIIDRQKEEIK